MYALIIAGGEGQRLRPLTLDRPKPMVVVAGRPILEHQVRWLSCQGVTDIVFCCGYRAEEIRNHFDGGDWGVRIHYSLEEQPMGRGGALKLGYRLVPPSEDTILALNGDVITDQALGPFLHHHRDGRADATVMLVPLRIPYGVVEEDQEGRIVSFSEKSLLPYWINAGVYVLSSGVFSRFPDRGDHETTTFPDLAAEQKLLGYRSRAYWRTVDTAKDLAEAEADAGRWTRPETVV